jgi:hypothetical protein
MAWLTIFWLLVAWDSLTHVEKAREKWRSFRFGSKVYILLRRNNRFGNFLKLSEYGEKGRKSFVIIPKGEDGKGWTDCREQLSKLKHCHDKQKLGGSLPENHPGKISAGPIGLNKGKAIISSDQTNLQGVKKSYAEVVQGMDYTLSLNFQTMASKSKVGVAALEKFNGRNPLEDAMLAEMEEKEKEVIMNREEQVGVVTVRDMLSEFKKDLLKFLESFLVGWTPPSDVVNRAKKETVIGRPKLRKEKPKPHVKLTYFRKKSARPNTRWQKIARPETNMKYGPNSCPIQAIKPSGATRFLEKGEILGAGPCLASSVNLAISANDSRGNPECVGSGSKLFQVRLSPETVLSVSACLLEELQSRCGPGSPASLIVTDSGLPKIAASRSPVFSKPPAGPQSRAAQEDTCQSPPARGPVLWQILGCRKSPLLGCRSLQVVCRSSISHSTGGCAPIPTGERPNPPVSKSPNPIGVSLTFQDYQRSPVSGSV